MNRIKLKICGMKHNLEEVSQLKPDYLGFIFYDKSPRSFEGDIPNLDSSISRVGVFVNASLEKISEKIKRYKLDVIQLHGNETPSFCNELSLLVGNASNLPGTIEIWKVFSIKDSFNFNQLAAYEPIVDKFLFDTKGKEKGGNGYVFDWNVLKDYASGKPFILSGGIGLEEIPALKTILETELPIHAIDVNSKFESSPGFKNIHDLKKLIDEL